MKIKRCFDESGMSTIMFGMVTIGAMGFISLYINLSAYIAGQSTVDAAANAVMRCLVPTDADCVTYTQDPPPPIVDWMGYQPGGPPKIAVWQHDKQYSGSMDQKTWGAEYTTYESNWHQRQVAYNTYSVPVKEFKPEYGRYRPTPKPKERTFSKEVVHYAPVHKGTKHFPSVETDVSANWASWVASHPLYETLEKPKPVVTVRPGTVGTITHTIEIPELKVDPPDASCIDNNNQPCDVSSLAGGTEGKDEWKKNAYFALKVFAEIRAVGGPDAKAEAKWGKGDEAKPAERAGLWLEIFKPNGELLRKECLGGRVDSGQVGSDGWTGYNLWARGPKGATGGPMRNASCSKGNKHQNISVPRGGSVKIIAHLRAHKDRDPIEANVNFAWFFDNYERNYKKYTTTATCTPVFRPGKGSSECIEAEHCGLSPEWKTNTCLVDYLEDHTQSTCEHLRGTVEFFPPEPKFSYRVPICDGSWHIDPHNTTEESPEQFPEVFSELQKNSEVAEVKLVVCDWKEVKQVGNVDVGSVPDNCPLAVPEKVVHACQDAPVGAVNEIEDCHGIDAIKSQWQKNTASMNNGQNIAPNQVVFPEEVELSWNGGTKNRWVESWTPPEYNGSPITGGALRVKADNKLQNEKHLLHGFEREIAPTWIELRPKDFLSAIKAEGGNKEGVWQEYVKKVDSLVKVVERGTTEVPMTSVYPFKNESNNSNGTKEIYWGQKIYPPLYDFDLDGEADEDCGYPYDKFDDLEAMLRHHAGSVLPEAIERQGEDYVYKFNAGEEHTAMRLLGITDQRAKGEVKGCATTITKKRETPGKNDKAVFVKRSIERPAKCDDGTYLYCYSVAVGDAISPGEIIKDTDFEGAISVGMREMEAVFPQAHFANKCEDSDKNCYSVEIDDDSVPDRSRVLVRYNVPLAFPFNELLQSDTLPVYSLKDEIEQLATIR